MITRLTSPYLFSNQEKACITQVGKNWKSKANCIIALKENMNIHFDSAQNKKCCYCGLKYNETGRGEIEHIAPQETNPDFAFHRFNLAKACQLCNSSSMKHTKETIVGDKYPVYKKCKFKIIHPYLDDPNEHLEWKYGMLKIVVKVKNNSSKGRESIQMFDLASESRTTARAKQRNHERLQSLYNLPDAVLERVKRVMVFR